MGSRAGEGGQVGQELLRCPFRVCSPLPISSPPQPSPAQPRPQPFQCPPPLEKPSWDSIPSQLLEFRSSCPRLVGEGARNAGAEAWATPDRAGSEFWECLCSWSPLGEGAGPLINPSLVPREGPGPCTRVEGVGTLLQAGLGGGGQPPVPCLVESQTGAWRSGALHLLVCMDGVWAHVGGLGGHGEA